MARKRGILARPEIDMVMVAPEAATTEEVVATPKAIVVFSDGTGNSSGKLHKTNVWRMYLAADLGVPTDPKKRLQIGRYDNGVGTSSFRPFALLGGVLGIGLKNNVLSLYSFLCRNYKPADPATGRVSDEIYAFGFSRGAYTIRVLIDLIDKQGIIPYSTDRELKYLVRDAYREYRYKRRPRMVPMRWMVPFTKWLARENRRCWQTLVGGIVYDSSKNHRTTVEFVGVWDTVGAYGGPFAEVVRAFDDWITPITPTDQKLPDCVRMARHALAIDDERDSFQPVPWHEPNTITDERLLQVWFAGMHSDVGGGYPNDSLAYVSLVWMMDEAKHAGLRLLRRQEVEARRQSDSFGPIHDSRSGFAGYYRYQPRKIGAYIEPPEKGSGPHRDPETPDDQGLRARVAVHDSVFCRILSSTDGYAPITIPHEYRIVADRFATRSPLPAAIMTNLTNANKDRALMQSALWDRVWKRRILYFGIVIVSLLLASMPIWPGKLGVDTSAAGVGGLLRIPFIWLASLAPDILGWWLDAFAKRPVLSTMFSLAIFLLFQWGGSVEVGLRDETRKLWKAAAKGAKTDLPTETGLQAFRTSRPYEWIVTATKWYLLPGVLGIAGVVLLALGLIAATVQVRLNLGETSGLFCAQERSAPPASIHNFSADDPCVPLWANTRQPMRAYVVEDQIYVVEFEVLEPWKDGDNDATPVGIAAGQLMPLGSDALFLGFRRAVDARWMQPLVHIRPFGARLGSTPVHIQPLDLAKTDRRTVFRGQFTAARTGALSLFVNEAAAPWPISADHFYRGRSPDGWPRVANAGTACVRIWPRALSPHSSRVMLVDCDAGRQATREVNETP